MIKALEIKTSVLFKSDFASNTILFLFFIFLIVDLYFIAKIFNPIAELVIPIGITTKEAKAEMETDPVIIEAKIRKFSV